MDEACVKTDKFCLRQRLSLGVGTFDLSRPQLGDLPLQYAYLAYLVILDY